MSKIGAVILAAGMSKRMGEPKLLLTLNGKPLFRYPLELAIASGLNPIVLIGGHHIESFREAAGDLKEIEFIHNNQYEQGMSTSLKLGVDSIKKKTEAIMIFLADQPFVSGIVIQTLMEQYKKGFAEGIRIVRPQYNGELGHPILVHESIYSEFLEITGDQGGKEILKKYRGKTKIMPFESPFWGMDIDTFEDYQKGKQYSNED